jgi:DNA topoisomerase-1
MLPPLKIGQVLHLDNMLAKEGFTRPPARYTEASLVKKLEEMGIGRPSTYAPTITTIQKREYIIKESRDGRERNSIELLLKNQKIKKSNKPEITGAEKNKLFPTNTAMIVNDFLVGQFPKVIDYSFTANIEKELDEIAGGNLKWDQMIHGFYSSFHPDVETSSNISKSDIGALRLLGVDPASGKNIYARLARFGPCVQLGELDDEEKPKFSSLRKDQLIETITIEDALELFKMPRKIGEYEEMPVEVNIGRFGPYVKHANKFYGLEETDDPLTISESRAIDLIETKRKNDASKVIKAFDEDADYQILNGKWGPYLKAGKKNVKLPKDKKPEELSYEECVALAEKAPDKKRGGRKR